MKKYKCSITVEASLCLPFFLFAVMSLFYIVEYIRLSNLVADSLIRQADNYINLAYPVLEIGSDKLDKLPDVITEAVGEIYLSSTLTKDINSKINLLKIVNGSFDFTDSKILKNNGYVDITVDYHVQVPFSVIKNKHIKMHNEVFAHGFVGYEPEDFEEDNIYVYITTNGTVYHLDSNCTHLKISVVPIGKEGLQSARNSSGGKYHPCERCISSGDCPVYYITNYGNKYHSSSSCSGLKRTVKKVKKSQVSGRRPCSKCSK